jgi:hypothetical protein
MSRYELCDAEEARRFLLQGLWWQRVLPPRPDRVRPVLEWALEIASAGQDLPPLGFLADLGHVAFGAPASEPEVSATTPSWTGVSPVFSAGGADVSPVRPSLLARWTALLCSYEDHVLGKFYTDWTFSRASDALRRYKGRDQARGLAFVCKQFAARSGFQGVQLCPGVLKSLLQAPPSEVHWQGWESLDRDGLHAPLIAQYEMLIAAARHTAEALGPEDVAQLQRGTALKPEGEQLAERQVLRAAHLLEASLPRYRLPTRLCRGDAPTHLLDEDAYPVGGFASLATHGSIESLLHSQLAYMEDGRRPDLFDIKFLRGELLYYARDENQFHRRRRTFIFVLYPDLDQTRFKDRGVDYQRGVLLLALLYVIVCKLAAWLSAEALSFRFLFVVEGDHDPLRPERDLLASLLKEEIADGLVQLTIGPENKIAELCINWARRSLCHALLIDVRPRQLHASDAITVYRLQIDGPQPAFGAAESAPIVPESAEPLESWCNVLQEILQCWI